MGTLSISIRLDGPTVNNFALTAEVAGVAQSICLVVNGGKTDGMKCMDPRFETSFSERSVLKIHKPLVHHQY